MYCTLSDLIAAEDLKTLIQLTVDDNGGVTKSVTQAIGTYTVTGGYIEDRGVVRSDTSKRMVKVPVNPGIGEYAVNEITGVYTFNESDTDFSVIISWLPLDTDVVNSMIAKADNEINGYISGRYTVPIAGDVVPYLLTDIAAELSLYRLYQRRRRQKMSESMETGYKLIINKLKDIQKGVITFPELSRDDETPYTEIRSNKTPQSKMYGANFLKAYY